MGAHTSGGVANSAASSRTTHGAASAVDACGYLGALLVGAVAGIGKAELLAGRYTPVADYWEESPLVPEIEEIVAGSFKSRQPPEIESTGYVVKTSGGGTLGISSQRVVWREGCRLAVNLGGDADTCGAVYGQLAGAFYGEQGFPRRWLHVLAHRPLMIPGRKAVRPVDLIFCVFEDSTVV